MHPMHPKGAFPEMPLPFSPFTGYAQHFQSIIKTYMKPDPPATRPFQQQSRPSLTGFIVSNIDFDGV